jgi:hypothetical protein
MTDPKNPKNPKSIALESFRLIETGDARLAERIIAPGFRNQEADDDPDDVERQLPGPAGFLATSQADEKVVMAAATMTGEHTGVFDGIEPTGTRISHNQVHIFHIADGQITNHRAVRDDLGLLLQLGRRPSGCLALSWLG